MMQDLDRDAPEELTIGDYRRKSLGDTVHWAGKKESPLLQLADTCAFVIRGHLNDRRFNQPLYSKLHPVMVARPKSDAERK